MPYPFPSAPTLVSSNRPMEVNHMSQANSTSGASFPVLKSFCVILGIVLLGVSCYHGGSFLWRTSEAGHQRIAMLVMVVGLLATSHCLAHLVGHAFSTGKIFIALLCVATSIPIEGFSIITSTAALDNRIIETTRRENHASPEYKRAVKNVENIQNQLDRQMLAMEKLPANQGSNSRKANEAITATQIRLQDAQNVASAVNVSSTDAVYKSIEGFTGFSSSDVSRMAAVMLSIAPLVLGIAVAGISGPLKRFIPKGTKAKATPVKKRKRHLQAV